MTIAIRLAETVLPPGGVVRGRVELAPATGDERRRVELSVLWETAGTGTRDLGVVFFRVLAKRDPAAARATHEFEADLPVLPLSYDGGLLGVRWLVRVRRLRTFSDDDVVDEPFEVRAAYFGTQ